MCSRGRLSFVAPRGGYCEKDPATETATNRLVIRTMHFGVFWQCTPQTLTKPITLLCIYYIKHTAQDSSLN